MQPDSKTIPAENGDADSVKLRRNRPAIPMSGRWRTAVIVTAVTFWSAMFVGTHIPNPDLGELPEHSDKAMHLLAYGGLAFLLGLWRAAFRRMTLQDYGMIFGLCAVYAVCDELLQAIPVLNRQCDVFDGMADGIGAALGLAALFLGITVYRRLHPELRTVA